MNEKRVVLRNVLCNTAGMATHLLTGFIVAPFLISRLGQEQYGFWVLIASLTGYFSLLDLGVSGSIGRNLAFHHARNDRENVNAIVSTAWALLCGIAAIALLGTLLLIPLFFVLFKVPPDHVGDVSLALALIGFNLALTFPVNVWGATLWGLQRFDVMNAIVIPILVLRTVLTFWLVPQGCGLTGLALIVLTTTVLEGIGKLLATFWLDPSLRLRRSLVRKDVARGLWGYGIWYFFLSMERSIGERLVLPIIGVVFGAAGATMATVYSIPSRLIGYASTFLISATQVLTPLATKLHAEQQEGRQRWMVLEGGKYCLAIGLFIFTLFGLLGHPMISLWVGRELADQTWGLLMILALGEVLPMSQWIGYSTILGMGRHKPIAWLSIAEGLTVVTLTLTLSHFLGLAGVCLAVAIPGAVCRGVCQMIYACRLVELPLTTYLLRGLLPALLVATMPALALWLLVNWHTPTTWTQLFATGAFYGLCFVGIGLFAHWLGARRRSSSPSPSAAPEEDEGLATPELAAEAPAGS